MSDAASVLVGVRRRTGATDAAIVASAGAALVHLVLIPASWIEHWAAGLFFTVIALGQALLALSLLHHPFTARTLLLGAWGNVAVITTWVVSRTAGIPFTPHGSRGDGAHGESEHVAGSAEPIGSMDVLALGAELSCVILLLGLMSLRQRRTTANGLAAAGAVLWASAALGVLS